MSKYPTNDFNLRFFFMLATGPNYDHFSGKTIINDTEKFYLSNEVVKSIVYETNTTNVTFIRNFDER